MTEQEHVTPPEGFKPKNFTQVISLIVGAGLFVMGASGLLYTGFAGLHLSWFHSLLLCIAGGVLFYNGGWKDNSYYAFLCCLIFGAFFGGLGLIGFILGTEGVPTIGHTARDPNLFVIKQGFLEYGRLDHILNAIVGIILMGGALDWQRRMGASGGKRLREKALKDAREEKRHYKLTPRHQ